jgi:hypothetical protein
VSRKTVTIPKLIASSVVRGSEQGESHGGLYTIDFTNQDITQHIDWNTVDIDFTGRGWDRGLRGIEFYRRNIYIAASDELFIYDEQFSLLGSYKNPYLKHCHEICLRDNLLFITSTGYDSLLAFDMDSNTFVWGFYISSDEGDWLGQVFDPNSDKGPSFTNEYHINNVHIEKTGIYFSGLHTHYLLHIDEKLLISKYTSLPAGAHNAMPFKNGVLFNDTQSNCVRYTDRNSNDKVFPVPVYNESQLEFMDVDDSKVARQGFGRGLCTFNEQFIVAGSSPSTISVYDLVSGDRVTSVNLTMDIRNAIHGLEVWPE